MRPAAMVAAAVLVPGTLLAQIPGVTPGDTVRFTSDIPATAGPAAAQRGQPAEALTGWRIGAVTRVTADSLLAVTPRANVPLAIHIDSIYALDVSRGRLSRMTRLKTWGTAGVLVGMLVGALVADQDIESVAPRLVIGGAVGLGLGAGISASRPGPYRWVQVRIPACRPRPGVVCLSDTRPADPAR